MRSVMITGASRGIGLEFVRQYLADGYKVYATCHKIAGAERLKALPSNGRGKIDIMEMDVTNVAQVKAVAKRLNGMPIDVLINNAGTVEPTFYGSGAYEGNDDPDLRNYDFDAWLELLKTNVLGPPAYAALSSTIFRPASAPLPSTYHPPSHPLAPRGRQAAMRTGPVKRRSICSPAVSENGTRSAASF